MSISFTGFPYTVALRTGNPAAVNSSFLIFFPFAFLTPAYLPRELMTGWMQTVARLEPGDLPARGDAVADVRRLGTWPLSARELPPSPDWVPSRL